MRAFERSISIVGNSFTVSISSQDPKDTLDDIANKCKEFILGLLELNRE